MCKKMREHKQVEILDPISGYLIEVDEGLATLLKAIWNLGISTCNSCQENKPGIAWIEFLRCEDAEAFLTRMISGLGLAKSPETDARLYARIMGQLGGWQYNAHTHDVREYMNEESGLVELKASEPCEIAISISIRFPVGDLGRLLDLCI